MDMGMAIPINSPPCIKIAGNKCRPLAIGIHPKPKAFILMHGAIQHSSLNIAKELLKFLENTLWAREFDFFQIFWRGGLSAPVSPVGVVGFVRLFSNGLL